MTRGRRGRTGCLPQEVYTRADCLRSPETHDSISAREMPSFLNTSGRQVCFSCSRIELTACHSLPLVQVYLRRR